MKFSLKVFSYLVNFLALFIFVGLLSTISVRAQNESPRSGRTKPNTARTESKEDSLPTGLGRPSGTVLVSGDDDYKLAPSDVVEVIIEDAPELSGNYRVNKSGTLPLKYLGSILVAGKTTEDVTTIIADGLRGRYLRDPKVYITVKQYNSRTFFIQGAIRSPGVYVIEGRPSLFKLISLAGGLPENHGSTAYIIREKKVDPVKLEKERAGIKPESRETTPAVPTGGATIPTPASRAIEDARAGLSGIDGETEYELLTAKIGGLYRGNFEQNLLIQPNDLVYIPTSEVFFVVGDVKSPGQFTLREGSSLRQAISLSQGLLFKAASNRALIFRQDPVSGKLNEIQVDIGAVLSGKSDDVALAPNDVIMVPNSKMKTIAGTMLQTMGMAMAQTLMLGAIR